ncbi:D-glycerate dehydrogenase [Rossellomorea aquimaris]|uniref:2-hydroxyacid dehydrogenase n=1 Tax=Rossellomorea aquimaris TaxID=189382 RepID=UPI001CD56B15|nr:D-glycerate dehydrogenase [Rossellomorea aquimaris]MCA1061144.1 D-glycerate dehydrogenase [Rossellomorea aquimaris]
MKPFIYITRKLPESVIEPLMDEFEVEMWNREDAPVPRDILLEKAEKASALLTMLSDKIDRELLQNADSLRIVSNLAVGYDNIDLKAANEKGVTITNTPDVLTETTADLTFALLLAVARRIVEADRYIKEGKWKSWSPLLLAGADIHHKTMGIVGMGSIGEAVAKRAKGFNMNVLYYNRSRKHEAETSIGVQYALLDELLSQSDFVVILAPLNPETEGMFQENQFKKMKKTAILINAARGPIVNEEELIKALKRGDIAGAGLDVFETEPISEDHPLLAFDQVVALPHIGSSSEDTRYNMMTLCVENIQAVLKGDLPKTAVN